METVLLNEELSVSIPDGFRILSEEERNAMAVIDEPPAWCIRDDSRHLVLSAFWRKIGGLSSLLIDEKAIIKHVEETVSKPMKQYGYQLLDWETIWIGNQKAEGVCYSYQVNDTAMTADSFIVKNHRTLYYFHIYSQSALYEENKTLWSVLFQNAGWER